MRRVPDNGRLRVAVVGAGLMGRWHAYFARRLGAEVAAVVDRSPEAARFLARRAGGAGVYDEMGAMLEAARPHVVHVCTPLASHISLALQAVEAGTHALVEKPLTRVAGETQALLRTAEQKGVHVCPVHQFAFQAGVVRAAGALRSLGDALHVSFAICSAGGGEEAGPALDDIVADILPHPFSIVQALWPDLPLEPQDWTAGSRGHGELCVQGSAGGVPVSAYVSMNARPTRCEMDILCRGGSIHVNLFHGYSVVCRGKPSRLDKVSQPFLLAGKSFAAAARNLAARAWRREWSYPGLGPLISRFYAAARGAGDNPVAPRDALAAAVVREHILQQSLPHVLLRPGTDAAPLPPGRIAT